VDWRP